MRIHFPFRLFSARELTMLRNIDKNIYLKLQNPRFIRFKISNQKIRAVYQVGI